MKFEEVIGIDVSKHTIDVYAHIQQTATRFENTKTGYRKLISCFVNKVPKLNLSNVLFCFEHTGLYSFQLASYLEQQNASFVIVCGLEIKRSMGITRGKNDKIDAQRIAQYAYLRKDEIPLYKMPEKDIRKLKQLLSLREKLVKQRTAHKLALNEQKEFLENKESKLLRSVAKKLIKELSKQIDRVEYAIDKLLTSNRKLKQLLELTTSVIGVGRQTALHLIAVTNGFTLFSNYRKLASYAGVAPFPYSSGTSIKGKSKVSNLANKKIKTLLSACATSAIKNNPEMKIYFLRKLNNGTNKMKIINAVRNKILARIFAVVKRGTPFVPLQNHLT